MAGRGSGGQYLLAEVVKNPRSAFLKHPIVTMKRHIMIKVWGERNKVTIGYKEKSTQNMV